MLSRPVFVVPLFLESGSIASGIGDGKADGTDFVDRTRLQVLKVEVRQDCRPFPTWLLVVQGLARTWVAMA